MRDALAARTPRCATRGIAWAFVVFAFTVAFPVTALAGADCGNGGWDDQVVAAHGDESGIGGTGARSGDSGLGGTGARGDDSGIGGTGIFGVVGGVDRRRNAEQGAAGGGGAQLCVNGTRVQLAADVQVVFEKGLAVGADNLRVGQTVWLVGDGASGGGLGAGKVWVLPRGADEATGRVWLEARMQEAGDLAYLSVEGAVTGWRDGDRFEIEGVWVDATAARDLRSAIDAASRVRVSGALARDGLLRAERLSIRSRPPVRPSRPSDRPPRIDRPPTNERPVRPDTSIRPNSIDRLAPTRR